MPAIRLTYHQARALQGLAWDGGWPREVEVRQYRGQVQARGMAHLREDSERRNEPTDWRVLPARGEA